MSQQKIMFHQRKPSERIKKVAEVKDVLFSELKVLNVILTNACNLSCSYCFEQHKKDYGKFSMDQLKQMYDFFLGVNNLTNRNFQFFGGEPLAQKAKILEFCKTYAEELSKNKEYVRLSTVTNGLLLTPEFMEEYCSYDFTSLVISLDTHDAASNRRELTQENIDHIFAMIRLIPDYMMREHHHCAIRCTINEESVPHLKEYIVRLYDAGVRNFVIHPLIMSRSDGIIAWSDEAWNEMHDVLSWTMLNYPDFKINWAEGVGVKGESNCMVGSDMIAMDASGDFSGCYFFTNLKEQFGETMLGNLYRDEIYIDRYINFQKAYTDALEDEQCKSCHLKNFCYQCPAGNGATGGKLFRPDSMCKRIVELFLTLREENNKQLLLRKYESLETACKEEGTIVQSRALLHFIYQSFEGYRLDTNDVAAFEKLPDSKQLMYKYVELLDSKEPVHLPDLKTFVESFKDDPSKVAHAYPLYLRLCKENNVPVDFKYEPNYSQTEDNYFIALMHLLNFNSSTYLRKFKPAHSRKQILDL